MKGEIERLEVEYNENICKEQAKYNLDTNKLKDQIFENEVIQKALEKDVSYCIDYKSLIYNNIIKVMTKFIFLHY